LRDSTQAANQLAHDLAGGSEEDELVGLAGTVRQKMTGARNHFSERNMIIDGLTKR